MYEYTKRVVRCEVLTAALLRIQVFWDVMLCHWIRAEIATLST
jgi:hypothetical protein